MKTLRQFLIEKPETAGITLSTAIMVALAGASFLLGRLLAEDPVGVTTLSTLASPLLAGFVAGRIWKAASISTKSVLVYSFSAVLYASLIGVLFAIEGLLCLIIVIPLLYVIFLVGVSLGSLSSKLRKDRARVSLAGFLVVILALDVTSSHHYKSVVSDEVRINASPEIVWQHVASYPPITTAPHFWFFKIGLPSPLATTVTAYKEGAGRKCIFSNGIVFDERMVTYDSARELTFDITHQPADPEILGHLTLERGQFLLHENADGTTQLTGTSWYELHLFPAWYFDLWAQAITSNVHIEAMQHIKRLSEGKQ